MTDTTTEIMVGPVDEIPLGEGRTFVVGDERVAVFRTRSGQLFAVQAECPHKRGPLADGLLGGTMLICPLHSWKFDLRSGDALMGDCGLRTYAVRVDESGQIVVSV
ncbi:MAG TPA: Rieske 2Fe-2S domain-containing protein [Bryobacteraceae bacterium]